MNENVMGARSRLYQYVKWKLNGMRGSGNGNVCVRSNFFFFFKQKTAYEIAGMQVLEREVFGPILHVVRYRVDRLDQVLDAIAGTGYGLTLGVHSRIDSTVAQV